MENQFNTTLNYKDARLAVSLFCAWVSENFNKRIKKTEAEFREILLEIDRIECAFYLGMNSDIDDEISAEHEILLYKRLNQKKYNVLEPLEMTYSRLSQILAHYYRIKASEKAAIELYSILEKEHSESV